MKKPFFHSCMKILILAVIASLLAASGFSQANASVTSSPIYSDPAEPYPETKKADAQPSPPTQAEELPPQVAAADVRSPESDLPAPTEIRQSDALTLGQPSIPGDEWKPAPGTPGPELKPAQDHPAPAPLEDIGPTLQTTGWSTIVSENFEGTFPTGAWQTFDADGATNGEFFWAADDYKPANGIKSAWAARGGANGLDPEKYYYPNNAKSWMRYGPFDLSDATDAELLFNYWNLSEKTNDIFFWGASTNGSNFYGTSVSGDSGGWNKVNFDLTAVPNLGNLTGLPSVWIAFAFYSDGNGIVNDGPFVDDIALDKYIPTALPNLTPYTPNGWDYPIVPSNVTGTHTVSTLYTDQPTYIDWAVLNSGSAISASAPFTNCLYLDNNLLQCWDWTQGLNQNYYFYYQDWVLNLTPTPGPHTLKIIADVNNVIAESNESDNVWENSFTWTGSALPNLTPFTPNGWDFPIVPSSTTGTNTVSTLFTAQNTYIDWAVINSGASTSTTFASCLYFDNNQLSCWNIRDGLNQNEYAYVEDWLLSLAPTAGSHTLKIVADVNNIITESNESDNTWEHSFVWTASTTTYRVYMPLLLKYQTTYFEGPWEVEPNNTYQQANGPLRSDQNYFGYPNDNKDYFSIYLPTSGHIAIDLTNTVEGVQLQLFYQTTDNRVAADTEPPFRIEYNGGAGWYYIYIYTSGNYNTSTAYTLKVTYP